MSNGHARPQSGYVHGRTGAPASKLHRWKSESGISEKIYQLEKGSVERPLLECNRESMKALSEFLMTRDPPPTSWVSIASPDEDSSTKKAAFKFFRRSKSKKSKKKKLLKLPDSAVAATTSSGSRHIAISIPLEGWPIEKEPTKSASERPQSRLISERPAVRVLKPVVEVRESSHNSTQLKNKDDNQENRFSLAKSDTTPAAEILGPEATRTLENYYTQLNRQQKRESPKPGTSRSQRSYVVIRPNANITRQDSQRTDPRHSAGTMYSTASIASPTGHSRGASSASTAPSATASNSRKLGLPDRNSSLTKFSPSLQPELAQIAKTANDKPQDDPPAPSVLSHKSADGSISSGITTSQSPQTVFGTAETAQNYSAGAVGLQTVSKDILSKPPSPAPTKRLPDIPVNQTASSPPRRSAASSVQTKSTPQKQSKSSSPGREANAEEALQVARQIRQDRVKARKLRDMAIVREKSIVGSRTPLENGTGNNYRLPLQTSSHLPTPPRNPKRRNPSQEVIRKKANMTFSPIMVVASTSPTASQSASPPTSTSHRSNLLSPQDSPDIVQKLPHNSLNAARVRNKDIHSSLESSFVGSDSDTIPLPHPTQKRASNSTIRSLVSSNARSSIVGGSSLDARRQERRSKRNMSLKEKELDARLKKIERDNAMLLGTLGTIASSFQELNHLCPNGKRRGQGGRALLEDSEKAKKGGESGDEAGLDA